MSDLKGSRGQPEREREGKIVKTSGGHYNLSVGRICFASLEVNNTAQDRIVEE